MKKKPVLWMPKVIPDKDSSFQKEASSEVTEQKGRQFETRVREEKRQFETGAQREVKEGKGRYDLISPLALRRVAGIYERGASAYGDRNWEKGLPLSSFVDSALRHLYQFVEGKQDEDHAAACLWNIIGLVHTEEMIFRKFLPESLNDLPNYTEIKKKEE